MIKLSHLNLLPGNLFWIHQAFLSNCLQCCYVNNTLSKCCTVTSSVPQGSGLALLFLIFIDLSTNLSSIAYDCVIYYNIRSPSDALSLQDDLDSISWCSTWLLSFTASNN